MERLSFGMMMCLKLKQPILADTHVESSFYMNLYEWVIRMSQKGLPNPFSSD